MDKNSPTSEIRIGHLRLPRVLAAPMAGVTDLPFRLVLRDFFQGLAFTEMLSAEAVVRHNPMTALMSKLEGGITGVQLVGSDPKIMAKAASMAEGWGAVVIDINAGCPDPHVTKKGGGAALVKYPGMLAKVVEVVADAVEVPVTVKLRPGWKEEDMELAKAAVDAGAQALTVHPRLACENYRTPADHTRTRRIVDATEVPVIASGDVLSVKRARDVLNISGAAGVMAARGMRGDPQLPWRIQEMLEGRDVPFPTLMDRARWLLIHCKHASDHFGEERGMKKMRKHAFWYLKGVPKKLLPNEMIVKMATVKEAEEVCRVALGGG
ncbi:MAG: tRNA dihydrouridine synthase DusB [Thermoplasmata archaeon]|nr:tRNA dihydrouridine synthase DusB [Thermoplasmata archaeon]